MLKTGKHLRAVPIGHVISTYNEQPATPIQPMLGKTKSAEIQIESEYHDALTDLKGFERIWLIAWLDRAESYSLKVTPYRDNHERGMFACRTPNRPNPIGLTCARLVEIIPHKGLLRVEGIDLLDETPILDIKPYIPEFDAFPDSRAGWFDKASPRGEAGGSFT